MASSGAAVADHPQAQAERHGQRGADAVRDLFRLRRERPADLGQHPGRAASVHHLRQRRAGAGADAHRQHRAGGPALLLRRAEGGGAVQQRRGGPGGYASAVNQRRQGSSATSRGATAPRARTPTSTRPTTRSRRPAPGPRRGPIRRATATRCSRSRRRCGATPRCGG